MLLATSIFILQLFTAMAYLPMYPELRSDLQKYQDTSRCFPDAGEWALSYRNYYADADLGGAAKCVKFSRYGIYAHFSTPVVFTFGQNGSMTGRFNLASSACYTAKNNVSFVPDGNGVLEVFHAIYIDCDLCFVVRHPYAANGYGCSLWRRLDTIDEPADCCEFIYDENCGASPKYKMYDSSCGW